MQRTTNGVISVVSRYKLVGENMKVEAIDSHEYQ
jgi:hypothetical protein